MGVTKNTQNWSWQDFARHYQMLAERTGQRLLSAGVSTNAMVASQLRQNLEMFSRLAFCCTMMHLQNPTSPVPREFVGEEKVVFESGVITVTVISLATGCLVVSEPYQPPEDKMYFAHDEKEAMQSYIGSLPRRIEQKIMDEGVQQLAQERATAGTRSGSPRLADSSFQSQQSSKRSGQQFMFNFFRRPR